MTDNQNRQTPDHQNQRGYGDRAKHTDKKREDTSPHSAKGDPDKPGKGQQDDSAG